MKYLFILLAIITVAILSSLMTATVLKNQSASALSENKQEIINPSPSISEETAFTTYTNDGAGISFDYPSSWSKKNLQDGGNVAGVELEGKEGWLRIVWGKDGGFGGGCNNAYTKMALKTESVDVCESLGQDGIYSWGFYKNTDRLDFSINGEAKAPYTDNKDTLLSIFRSMIFTQ